MAELVEAYLDLPLGIVGAAVIAIAERLRLTEIATLDHRHGSVTSSRAPMTDPLLQIPATDGLRATRQTGV
jgi:predicted nucleic acid-binding protein